MTKEQKIDRYLEIVYWARRRYTDNGRIVIYVGGTPSAYTRIEDAAAVRYLDTAPRYLDCAAGG